jgi:hypothetical protein
MAGKKAFERNIILNHLTSKQILVIIACVILYRYISHRGLYTPWSLYVSTLVDGILLVLPLT